MSSPPQIDIPFDRRYQCWFCGEPCRKNLAYYAEGNAPHPSLALPACDECVKLAEKQPLTSIWECRVAVKDALMRIYAKHLAIGINWTEEELAESEFSCKVFAGFKKSAWMMYQIARDRVNYPGWPIHIDGVELDCQHNSTSFEFDGVNYTSVHAAIHYYSQQFTLDSEFFAKLVRLVGRQRFGFALRLARIHIASAKEMKRQVLAEVQADVKD
ncbi:hypothetical protein [Shewanella acanthi]|uniref:hypothetical protein n=1 Tax=Shewanella acanthi TaxID=2864212 RepID=UPI001C65FAE1|nr:hypothetical protein [Shewanella acanthi]QYJ77551.1 hypothetical protein K0H61_10375 [Shewanella acanthi]